MKFLDVKDVANGFKSLAKNDDTVNNAENYNDPEVQILSRSFLKSISFDEWLITIAF